MPPATLDGRRRSTGLFGVPMGIAAMLLCSATGMSAQPQGTLLKGDAALKHPAVQLAVKAAELMKAGKMDDAIALRSKSGQADWKAMSAADRKDLGAGMAERAPDPKAFADAVLKSGELTINGDTAMLEFTVAGSPGVASFEREAGAWRMGTGPMVFGAPPDPSKETRVENADILKHPIATLALQYFDLIHAGKIEDAKKLATAAVQALWKTEPASEKTAALAYLKKNMPTRAAVTAGLQTGTIKGILLIDDDKLATLNLITTEQRTSRGTATSSSTTTAIAFEMEGGQWRLRQ